MAQRISFAHSGDALKQATIYPFPLHLPLSSSYRRNVKLQLVLTLYTYNLAVSAFTEQFSVEVIRRCRFGSESKRVSNDESIWPLLVPVLQVPQFPRRSPSICWVYVSAYLITHSYVNCDAFSRAKAFDVTLLKQATVTCLAVGCSVVVLPIFV